MNKGSDYLGDVEDDDFIKIKDLGDIYDIHALLSKSDVKFHVEGLVRPFRTMYVVPRKHHYQPTFGGYYLDIILSGNYPLVIDEWKIWNKVDRHM